MYLLLTYRLLRTTVCGSATGCGQCATPGRSGRAEEAPGLSALGSSSFLVVG